MDPVLAENGIGNVNGIAKVSLRCPHCRQQGIFGAAGNAVDLDVPPHFRVGLRRCPNEACNLVAYLVLRRSDRSLLGSYPAETIDFDATDLPTTVIAALEEAIQCHAAGCYRASALMIRRTLEELCADRGANGGNLKERVAALGGTVILPRELLDGLDSLRLLGNDAAHIESRVFSDVGKDEVELALAVTKEVLKAVYQYSSLIAQLNARRTP